MLIEAAARCLAAHGIQGFTIDRICREAGVSRGLINHYFDGKDALLVEVYRTSLYGTVTGQLATAGEKKTAKDRLVALVEASFLPETFSRCNLMVWLALWGAVATNPHLQATHRDLYRQYRARLAAEITAVAAERGVPVEGHVLARSLIALIDGLWLEWCLDPSVLNLHDARQACFDLLECKIGAL